jgi:integrase
MKALERIRLGGRGQGTLARFADSRNWVFCHYVRGTEHQESTGTPDLRKARRVAKRRLDEVAADRQGLKPYLAPKARQVRVGALLDELKTDYRLRRVKSWASVESHLKPIRAHFGDWAAVEVTAEAADRYIEGRQAAGLADATINREVQLLGQAFRLALARGKVSAVPSMRQLPERNTRQGFFERPEFEAVAAALPAELADVARFGHITGWRKQEILTLCWTDVDRDAGVIRLRPEHSKNGEGRVVPFAAVPQLGRVMERRWQARLLERDGTVVVADLVFHRQGAPLVDFRKRWAAACRAASLVEPLLDAAGQPVREADGTVRVRPAKLFHDLRRTAVRNMVRAGVDPAVAMRISGHRTRAIFDRYNIVSERDLDAALRQTARYVEALPMTREATA